MRPTTSVTVGSIGTVSVIPKIVQSIGPQLPSAREDNVRSHLISSDLMFTSEVGQIQEVIKLGALHREAAVGN